ncbi:MAG: metallophosphoesterase [Candidatus Helarchaeota archaeon]
MARWNEVVLGFVKCGLLFGIMFAVLGMFFLNCIGPWLNSPNYKPPHLSFIGDPSTSMGIAFETPEACNATVYYGLSETDLNMSQTDNQLRTLHFFNLTNLLPNTTYYYLINASERNYAFMNVVETFRTAPPFGSKDPIHFAVLGDTRPDIFGMTKHKELLDLIKPRKPDFILNVGDIVLGPTYTHQWDRFFYEIGDIAKNIPYMVSMGNHEHHEAGGEADAGRTYLKYMHFPGVEEYYAFNYSNACFISMNIQSEESITAEQLDWLNKTLTNANNSVEINWIIVYFHTPPYCTTESHPVIVERVVEPYLVPFKVDLVLAGHHHHYERLEIDGIPYVISGGGGAELDLFVAPTEWTSFIANTYQFCDILINGTVLNLYCIDYNNLIIDQLTLTAWRNV